MKKCIVALLFVAVLHVLYDPAQAQSHRDAILKGDLKALAAFYSDESDSISYDGTVLKGWDEIRESHRKEFAERKGEFTLHDFWSWRSLVENVGLFHGIWQVEGVSEKEKPAVRQAIYATIIRASTEPDRAYTRLCYRAMVPTRATPTESGPLPDLKEVKGISEPEAIHIADRLNEEFETAYNARDAKGTADTFAVDGALRSERGTEVVGRIALGMGFLPRAFDSNPDMKVSLSTNGARFLDTNLLVTDGVVEREGTLDDRPPKVCFFRVSVKEDDRWQTKLLMRWLPFVPKEDE